MPTGKLFFASLLLLLFFFTKNKGFAQKPLWVAQLANTGDADAHSCTVAANGNIYVAGTFTGTLDLDPSANTYNIASNGGRDIFLACYKPDGSFVWGMGFGGLDNDVLENISSDNNSNPIIVGQFRDKGRGVNFNPGGAAKYLYANGGSDGFVAKYSSSGGNILAINLGGNTEFDDILSVTTDPANNIYVGGDFHGTMDIDPTSNAKLLNSNDGTGCLLKYSNAGQLVWGFNFGGGGVSGIDNTVWGLKCGSDNFLYLTGCFQGKGDFDPSSNSAIFTALATDAYVAKYSTDGAYQFAVPISGANNEQGYDLALDKDNNIYITGYTESPKLNWGSSFSENSPNAKAGKPDIFLTKYDSKGQQQWGFVLGGTENDVGWGLTIANDHLYTTGYFQRSCDFDPTAITTILQAKGKANDMYLCKYDLNGKLDCGFSVGDTLHENGRKIKADAADNLYVCGFLTSKGVDFDPSSAALILDSKGFTDGFLAKYEWAVAPTPPNGYLVGDTVCEGDEAYLQFIATAGIGPFTIQYTIGDSTYTVDHINSGDIFKTKYKPTATSVYVLSYMKSQGLCVPDAAPNSSASVLVYPRPEANAGKDTSVCPGSVVQLSGSGGGSYLWYPATGISDVQISDPNAEVNETGKRYLVVTNSYGCSDTSEVLLTAICFYPKTESPIHLCIGDTATLRIDGGDSFEWSPAEYISDTNTASPKVWCPERMRYTILVRDTVCQRQATLTTDVIVHARPIVTVQVKDIDCGKNYGQLAAGGGVSYSWLPAEGLSDVNAQAPLVRVPANTIYTVTCTDANGCSDTASAEVKVFAGNGRLFAPDAFTPNGDGHNDCYRVKIPGDVYQFDLQIFNRWGQTVFHCRDINDCWDGNFEGVIAPVGTYFYRYKAVSSICDNIEGNGDIQLIR